MRLERLALQDFPVHPYCIKLIHRWRPQARAPDVQTL